MSQGLLSRRVESVREPEPADEPALARLLADHPLALRALRVPASERRCVVALDARGALAACVLGVARPVAVDGERGAWTQIVAFAVRPEPGPGQGLGLGRTSPALAVAEAFQQRFGSRQQGAVLFGLPAPRAERFAERRLEWDVVREVELLVGAPGRLAEPSGDRVQLEQVRAFPRDVDQLATRAAGRHAALLARDRVQLDARFGPGSRGRDCIALARRGEQLVGYAVARIEPGPRSPEEPHLMSASPIPGCTAAGQRPLLVMDWLLDPEEECEGLGGDGAGSVLRAWLGRTARRLHATSVVALLPECSSSYPAFQRGGFRVHTTGSVLASRSFGRPQDAVWLLENWYCTLADFALP